ncbi:MAG: hypothetical protein LUE29_01150 [Lachnospiraceae bacterium]|nr:hypothetical protein [Lachnospiraceae bacterium]
MGEKSKGRKSLKPDVVMKDYLRSNEKFTDLINGVCFHGEQVVRPEELADEDTDQSYLAESAGADGQAAGKQTIHAVQKARDSIRAQVRIADETDAGQMGNLSGMAPAASKRCWTYRKKCGIW